MTDPKLAALRACIARVSRRNAPLFGLVTDADNRFISLWQARNRRTRVLMYRAKAEVVLHETVVGPRRPPRIKGF